MRAPLHLHVLFALALAAASACDPGVELGGRCAYNSDCPEGSACIVGRCGAECRGHRDCQLMAECLITDGVGRCALVQDRCPCPEGLACGEDDRCHSTCGAQCPDGVCAADGTCRRADADAGGTLDAGAPAGSDGGPFGAPDYAMHRTCALGGSDCDAGERCVRDGSATPVCRTPCTSSMECPNGERCARLADGTTDTYCSIGCNPVTSHGCPAGEGCDWLERWSDELDAMGAYPYARAWDCRAVTAAGTHGAPCAAGTFEDCAAGHTCLEPECTRLCPAITGGAESPWCASGERCARFSTAAPVSGVAIGYCDALP